MVFHSDVRVPGLRRRPVDQGGGTGADAKAGGVHEALGEAGIYCYGLIYLQCAVCRQ